MFTDKNYNEEKEIILNVIARQAIKKNFPAQYVEEMNKITHKMFKIFDFEINDEMFKSEKVRMAVDIVKEYHKEQERKYLKQEYLVHLLEVGSVLSITNNEDIVITGILHDLLEKTTFEKNKLGDLFGDKVVNYLNFLTDEEVEGSKEERFFKNWQSFTKCPIEVNQIKLLDIMSNTRSTMLCNSRYGKIYLDPINKIINPYFLNCEGISENFKNKFNEMTKLSNIIVDVQTKFKIPELEKKYINKQKSIKKKQKSLV